MTDNTATHNEGLWFPDEAWATIASFLDNEDLARFRQLCSATQFVGPDVFILQPHYNRLYAIDKTLPPLLPQEDTLAAFKKASEKVQANQQAEIAYLTKHHPAIMAKREYVQVFQENTAVSLKSLEAKSAVLDEINSEIITARIYVNRSSLNLTNVGITRLPVTLFQEPAYANFWQNLIHLSCSHNKLTALNVQRLTALQKLNCHSNQLTTLNVQGLAVLQELWCWGNQLSTLNVQGLVALQVLECGKNQLTALNVQGLAALKRLDCWSNQLITLDVQGLTALQVLECGNNQLSTLNVQGLAALHKLSCWDNQLTALNMQGLAALKRLDCWGNPLKTLILAGVHASTKNKHAELERSLLFDELSQTESPEGRQAIISRLGDDYTYKNCLKYCPVYAVKLFAFDLANNLASSALSQVSAFLPSFGENPLKRKRDEDEVDREELSEEPDNQPPAKKRKRK